MKIIVVILILLILGLYFFTEPTKGLIKVTGNAVVKVTKSVFNEVRDSNEFKEIKQNITNTTKTELTKLVKR